MHKSKVAFCLASMFDLQCTPQAPLQTVKSQRIASQHPPIAMPGEKVAGYFGHSRCHRWLEGYLRMVYAAFLPLDGLIFGISSVRLSGTNAATLRDGILHGSCFL